MEMLTERNETWNVNWGWPDYDATSYAAMLYRKPERAIEVDARSTAVSINFMKWASDQDDARSGVAATPSPIDSFEIPEKDKCAEDRITLLSMKYASSLHKLSREENARLQILNEQMDIETPRYTLKDWEALNEAQELIEELARIEGD